MNDKSPIEVSVNEARETNEAPAAYRRPEVHDLGALEQVQAYYTGSYRDGPRSSYWYNG